MSNEKTASERAQEILSERCLGKQGIITLLTQEGFEESDIAKVAADTDWTAQGIRYLREKKDEMKGLAVLPVMLVSEMWALGFDSATALAAVDSTDCGEWLDALFNSDLFVGVGSAAVKSFLLRVGYPEKQVQAAVDKAEIDDEALCRKMAEDLLQQGISRRMLQERLIGHGFPKKLARQVIRALRPDWRRQAAMTATQMRIHIPFYDDAEEYLLAVGYTSDEAQGGMRGIEFGGQEAVSELIADYMEYDAVSPEHLLDLMRDFGFQTDDFLDTVDELTENTDWTEAGAQAIAEMVRANDLKGGPKTIRSELRSIGYTPQQIERAFERMDINWVNRAEAEFSDVNAERTPSIDSPASVRNKIQDMGYDRKTADEAVDNMFLHPHDEKQAALDELMALRFPMGYEGLRDALEKGGYSPEATAYALENVYFDWNDMASVRAQHFADEVLDGSLDLTPQWLVAFLEETGGFTPGQAQYAKDHVKVDWEECAAAIAADMKDAEEARGLLEEEGFTPEVIEKGLARACRSRNNGQ